MSSRRYRWGSSVHLLAFLAIEGQIGHHQAVAVFLLNDGEVFGGRVGVDDVGRFDAMQDHVHDRRDVGERLLLLAVEGTLLPPAETSVSKPTKVYARCGGAFSVIQSVEKR